MPELAPIAVFAYRRAHHLLRCLDSLARNEEAERSELFIFCDGPRSKSEIADISAVREIARNTSGFASVTPIFAANNQGLSTAIITGVTNILAKYERVIVIEDDLVLSPYFLSYMNEGLAHYERVERVASIHAYCYPVPESLPETFFLRGADCWGWGTWRNSWAHFVADGGKLLDDLRLRRLTRDFDLDGAYPYTRMLADQVAGVNDSWAIRWHASCYLRDLLTLYPGRSLVRNIGHDSSGTHSKETAEFDGDLADRKIMIRDIPVEPCTAAREAFIGFLRPPLWRRLLPNAMPRLRKMLRARSSN